MKIAITGTASATCLVDGRPYFNKELPPNAIFIGMEQEPNKEPRYGKLLHPWFNKPCYVTTSPDQASS